MSRLHAGEILPARNLETVGGTSIRIPDADRIIHLQFRRFAGCPICNRHLHEFSLRRSDIEARGVREVIIYHSTRENLLEYQGHLPFEMVADPEKKLYQTFGVESSLASILHPAIFLPGILGFGLRGSRMGPREKHLGLPADFLIDPNGRVIACKYGRHANDQWTVDEMLAHAPTLVNAHR